MNILVIDTSTDIELLALSADGKIYQYCENEGISHSVTMFRNLTSLLNQASLTINDINLLGVGIGPGSFTGIRIAVSTARMFSQIIKIPLVGLKSQEIYAASASGARTVIAAFDAKKSKVFGGVYSLTGSKTDEVVEPGDYHMEELLDLINEPEELLFIGDGCAKYIDLIRELSERKGFKYRFIDDFRPDGKAATELARRKYNESPDSYSDFRNTIPFYTRKSDAEIAKYSK